MRYLFILVGFLLLTASVHAADFIVHIPDELVEDGLKWQHFYSKHLKSNLMDDGDKRERERFFLEKCILDPSTTWILDSVIFAKTWGKIKHWSETGITVEVKE